jgi:hypothetical protein
MSSEGTGSGEYFIDLNAPHLESDSIPPPPRLPSDIPPLTHRDTTKMAKAEIRAVVPDVPDEDLVDHDTLPPPSK